MGRKRYSREEYWLASFSKPFKRLNCVTTSTNERKLLPYQSDQTHTDICNHYWQIEYWEKTVSEAQCHVILEKLSWCHSGKTAFDSLIKFPEGKKRHSRLIDSFQICTIKRKLKTTHQTKKLLRKYLWTVFLWLYGPDGHSMQHLILFCKELLLKSIFELHFLS